MSSFIQLLTKTNTYDVGTNQILQETLIVSNSEVWFIFQNHCQLWNIVDQKRLYLGKQIPGTFFYTLPAVVDQTTIALVRLENCDPQLETFNIHTNQVKTLAGFPNEQENYTDLFYFKDTGDIVIASKGRETRLYTWKSNSPDYIKELPFIKYDENVVFKKYNDQGAIACYPGSNNSNSFQLIKDGASTNYNLGAGLEQGVIKVVKQFSNNEAVVALVHNQKTTTVVLYDLTTGNNIKTTAIDFAIDMVLKVSETWIGIVTAGDDDESNVRVQACFSGDKQVKKQELPRGLRIWNDHMPIMVVSYEHKDTDEKKRQIITTVKCAQKRSIYINFMQKLGIIDAFDKEIVKEVINNFN